MPIFRPEEKEDKLPARKYVRISRKGWSLSGFLLVFTNTVPVFCVICQWRGKPRITYNIYTFLIVSYISLGEAHLLHQIFSRS